MNLSEQLKSPSRVGHLVRQITKEEWPMRLGDWKETFARCELLADTASRPAGSRKWRGKEVHALLYGAQIIRYDLDSGLWYCSIVPPKQDYPDGWESEAKLQRMQRRKLKAEREALEGLSTPPQKAKKKRKKKMESATPPASTLPYWAQPSPNAKKKRKPKLDWAQLKWGRKATRPPLPGDYIF